MEQTKKLKRGWIALHRKIEDSEIWQQEPWRLKTWLYFLLEANHQDVEREGQIFKRGQLYVRSSKVLGEKMRWRSGCVWKIPSIDAVKQFLSWLRKRKMITTRRTIRGLFITILNYPKYQKGGGVNTDFFGSLVDTPVDTEKHAIVDTEVKAKNKDKKEKKRPIADTEAKLSVDTEAAIYDKQEGNKQQYTTDEYSETLNINLSELILFFKEEVKRLKNMRIEIPYRKHPVFARLEEMMFRKDNPYSLEELKSVITYYLESEKAAKYPISLAVCFNDHTLNSYNKWKMDKESDELYA